MKFLFDFFPILLFFFAYKFYGIFIATGVAIGATVAQVAWGWFRHRKVQRMQLVTLAMIVVFGGATLLLKDEIFIKWKPSVINWLFGLVFLGSQFIGEQPMVQRMMGANLSLPKLIWSRLNLMWAVFFILLGSANLFVMYNFDTNTWVNFKLFGMFGLMLLFVFAQAIYLSRYVTEEPEPKIKE
jgi:intracellular septation protein